MLAWTAPRLKLERCKEDGHDPCAKMACGLGTRSIFLMAQQQIAQNKC